MLNRFFNDGRMDTVAYAHIGKYAENVYWDKASGLLDQITRKLDPVLHFLFPRIPKNNSDDRTDSGGNQTGEHNGCRIDGTVLGTVSNRADRNQLQR